MIDRLLVWNEIPVFPQYSGFRSVDSSNWLSGVALVMKWKRTLGDPMSELTRTLVLNDPTELQDAPSIPSLIVRRYLGRELAQLFFHSKVISSSVNIFHQTKRYRSV